MRLLDEQYTRTPFYGIRRMTAWLRKSCRKEVNHKRVARLLRQMGLEAIYPKPWLSLPDAQHKIYPYLLRDMPIVRANQELLTLHELIAHRLVQILLGLHRGRTYSV
jgi:putative transposase